MRREVTIILKDDLDDNQLLVELLDPLGTSDDDHRVVSISGQPTWVTWATLREFAEALLDLLPDEEKSWAAGLEPPD